MPGKPFRKDSGELRMRRTPFTRAVLRLYAWHAGSGTGAALARASEDKRKSVLGSDRRQSLNETSRGDRADADEDSDERPAPGAGGSYAMHDRPRAAPAQERSSSWEDRPVGGSAAGRAQQEKKVARKLEVGGSQEYVSGAQCGPSEVYRGGSDVGDGGSSVSRESLAQDMLAEAEAVAEAESLAQAGAEALGAADGGNVEDSLVELQGHSVLIKEGDGRGQAGATGYPWDQPAPGQRDEDEEDEDEDEDEEDERGARGLYGRGTDGARVHFDEGESWDEVTADLGEEEPPLPTPAAARGSAPGEDGAARDEDGDGRPASGLVAKLFNRRPPPKAASPNKQPKPSAAAAAGGSEAPADAALDAKLAELDKEVKEFRRQVRPPPRGPHGAGARGARCCAGAARAGF
jgi:hypothetical protein